MVNTFGAGFLYGQSPFREVQLFIDGILAGVVWPFPIIFTGGTASPHHHTLTSHTWPQPSAFSPHAYSSTNIPSGIVPGLWRPIVGIDAFDLREDEIDITPFLPLLCDGTNHTFQIVVSGLNDNGKGKGSLSETVGSYWVRCLFLPLAFPSPPVPFMLLCITNPIPSYSPAKSSSGSTPPAPSPRVPTSRVTSPRPRSPSLPPSPPTRLAPTKPSPTLSTCPVNCQ